MKNCDRGLENAARGLFFQALKRKKNSRRKTHASVAVTMVRDRKIRSALRTNQITGFVTVPAWKKIKTFILVQMIYIHCVCFALLCSYTPGRCFRRCYPRF